MQFLEADAQRASVISAEEAQAFLDQGFLVIHHVLVGEELAQVDRAMMDLVVRGSERVVEDPDFLYAPGAETNLPRLRRVEYVIDKHAVMKAMLAHPFILRTVEALQGPNFIPTWDSMVLKAAGEGIVVPWHRDDELIGQDTAAHSPPIFNVDFYLDPADLGTCLWVIPGSHRWSHEHAEVQLQESGGFDRSNAIPVPMAAGDVILHHVRLLHGSPSTRNNPLRRTVYYEFRPAETEEAFGPHTHAYVRLKQLMLLDCIARRRETAYGREERAFEYSPEGRWAIESFEAPTTHRYPHDAYFRTRTG